VSAPSDLADEARRLISGAARSLRGAGARDAGPSRGGGWDYAAWLQRRLDDRRKMAATAVPADLFSILTCLYDRSPAGLFRGTAASVLTQRSAAFEWIVVAQGELPDDLYAALREVAADLRVRCVLKPENQGIIRGLRTALEAASGTYMVPLDGDDVLCQDALSVLAAEIDRRGHPPFLYGDEDALVDGVPTAPYFRPDWDPLLNLASSYIWHPSAFDRRQALELGVFSDRGSEFCQDWDTVFRFCGAGVEPVHVPEMLYHWTAHRASSTNRSEPHRGSLASQRYVLQRELSRRSLETRFELAPFPLDRGLPELWPRRRRGDPPDVTVVSISDGSRAAATGLSRVARSCGYPVRAFVAAGPHALSGRQQRGVIAAAIDSGAREADSAPDVTCVPGSGLSGLRRAVEAHASAWTAVFTPHAVPEDAEWLWEAIALGELVPEVSLVSGRIVDVRNVVHGGGELWGAGDPLGCPDRGHAADEPGPYAVSLKPHCVSAVNVHFFVARTEVLAEALGDLPDDAGLAWLGVWLGMWAQQSGVRTAYSPLVVARCRRDLDAFPPVDAGERRAVARRFGGFPPPHPLVRLYSLTDGRGTLNREQSTPD
jgi:Glycosyl transferase family 2